MLGVLVEVQEIDEGAALEDDEAGDGGEEAAEDQDAGTAAEGIDDGANDDEDGAEGAYDAAYITTSDLIRPPADHILHLAQGPEEKEKLSKEARFESFQAPSYDK